MDEYLDAVLKARQAYKKQTRRPEASLKVMMHPRDYLRLETKAKEYQTLFELKGPRPLFGMEVELREEIKEGRFIITDKPLF